MMSRLALGLWNASESQFHSRKSPEEMRGMIKCAIKCGITLFDTAYSYTDASSILSSALKEDGNLAVISKVMPLPSLRKKVESELKRLKREYIDILLLHWPSNDERLFDALRSLSEVKDEGKAKAIGVSNFPPELLLKTAKDFEISYSEEMLSPFWHVQHDEVKVNVIAYGTMGFGALYGKSVPLFWKEGKARSLFDEVMNNISRMATRHGVGKDEVALSFSKMHSPYAIILGAHDNATITRLANSSITLDEDEFTLLEELAMKMHMESGCDNAFLHNWR